MWLVASVLCVFVRVCVLVDTYVWKTENVHSVCVVVCVG